VEVETALLAAVHSVVSPYRQKMLSYWVRPRDYEGFADFLQLGPNIQSSFEFREENCPRHIFFS
jgi:hypothetical protein